MGVTSFRKCSERNRKSYGHPQPFSLTIASAAPQQKSHGALQICRKVNP
ncbi:hypothetical protein [Oscillospiraceae bacterium]|nr:hypothetical protein [Oscillospiraceae bacterium]